MNVVLFDYGVGNLHSLAKALEHGGADVRVESEVAAALRYDAIVLPGVGAFGAASATIAPMAPALRAALSSGHPCLGICLGMQILFDTSEEGMGIGLGFMNGTVKKLSGPRIPHMGWNVVQPIGNDPLFSGVADPTVYYANSYSAEPNDDSEVIAWTEYAGRRFPAAVRRDRTWGVQFHPEKSGPAGLRIIRNFLAQIQS